MASGMIIMNSVDSDKLKPYLRGESDGGDSMNDPSLLHDSNGSADQMDLPGMLPLADLTPWMGKGVVRGPQSDLLGVLEELEREAEAEAGRETLWPAKPQGTAVNELETGLDPIIGSTGLRPVHSDSQKQPNKHASFTSPNAGGDLLQSLSAELPMPPPHPSGNHQLFVGANSRAREPVGQKAVLAGRKVQGDSSTMPFKPAAPFNLERVAHQHLLDLALNDLSPPVSEEANSRKQTSGSKGRKPSASHSASPGPMTIMRNSVLQEIEGVRQAAAAAREADSGHTAVHPAASSSSTPPPPDSSSPALPPATRSTAPPIQRDSSVTGSDQTQPSPRRSGIPSKLVIPRPEQSRDALQKTIYSTMSPTASGMLATINAADHSMLSPRPSLGMSRTSPLNPSESTSLLPSPPGLAAHADAQFRTYNSPGMPGNQMISTSLSRIPRSPADASGHPVDLTGMSLTLAASKMPLLGRSEGCRPATHRGSKIPLSPAGSATGNTRKSKSLTPRGKRDVTPEKQGQAMEAATAELDKLAIMLKQMQEDIKAIPAEPGVEAPHPLPTSPAPPHARKAFSNRRSLLDAASQNASLTPRGDSSTGILPGVDTPDNESLDKAEKMQETSTTVTVAGARGVRKPLHDAVAEEAEQGFGQPSEGFSEISEGLSKASVKRSEPSTSVFMEGPSKASVKRSDASEGLSQASAKRSECDTDNKSVGKPTQDGAGGSVQAKGKAASKSRSKRLQAAAEQDNKQEAENPVGRERTHIAEPQKVQTDSTGGNQLEDEQPPAESESKIEHHVQEWSSACLQPTEDDLVRVAVGKTSGVDAVVVHASPHRRTHNDLEQSDSLRRRVDKLASAHPQQPMHDKAAEPAHGTPGPDKMKAPLENKNADEPDPSQAKWACCFM